jgi:hypothetical protein
MDCNQFTDKNNCMVNKCHWCTDKYYYDICTDNPNNCYDEKRIDKLKRSDYIDDEKDFNTLYEIVYKNEKKNKIYIVLIIVFIILLIIYLIALLFNKN